MENTSFRKIYALIFFTEFVALFAIMFKFKSLLFNSKSLIILSFTTILTLSYCSTNDNQQLEVINELKDTLILNQENLAIDISLFRYRIEDIEKTLRNYHNDYNKTISQELGEKLSRYKVLKKIYNKQVSEYEFCTQEQKELTQQLENLYIDVKANRLDKKTFKTFFTKEKNDTYELINRSKGIKRALYEVEPEYIKLEKVLDFGRDS